MSSRIITGFATVLQAFKHAPVPPPSQFLDVGIHAPGIPTGTRTYTPMSWLSDFVVEAIPEVVKKAVVGIGVTYAVVAGNVLPFFSLTLVATMLGRIVCKAIPKRHRHRHEGRVQFDNTMNVNINHQLIIKHDVHIHCDAQIYEIAKELVRLRRFEELYERTTLDGDVD